MRQIVKTCRFVSSEADLKMRNGKSISKYLYVRVYSCGTSACFLKVLADLAEVEKELSGIKVYDKYLEDWMVRQLKYGAFPFFTY